MDHKPTFEQALETGNNNGDFTAANDFIQQNASQLSSGNATPEQLTELITQMEQLGNAQFQFVRSHTDNPNTTPNLIHSLTGNQEILAQVANAIPKMDAAAAQEQVHAAIHTHLNTKLARLDQAAASIDELNKAGQEQQYERLKKRVLDVRQVKKSDKAAQWFGDLKLSMRRLMSRDERVSLRKKIRDEKKQLKSMKAEAKAAEKAFVKAKKKKHDSPKPGP